jgi:prepilin-type processing-associated H-X9-DG protein
MGGAYSYQSRFYDFLIYTKYLKSKSDKSNSILYCPAETESTTISNYGIQAFNEGIVKIPAYKPNLSIYRMNKSDTNAEFLKITSVPSTSMVCWISDIKAAENIIGVYYLNGAASWQKRTTSRHGNLMNFAFVDGHVEKIAVSYLMNMQGYENCYKWPFYYYKD